MKKRIIGSLASILLVTALVGGATFAEFSSSQTSSANTFTAGTLNMQIKNIGAANYTAGTTATWASPGNWAPGDTVDGTIEFTNIGSINAKHIYFNFGNVSHAGGTGGINLMDKIIVTNVSERFNDASGTAHTTSNQTATVTGQVGDRVAPLTLAELVGSAYVTLDDQSGDNVVLAANDKQDYSLNFTFQFDPAAGNDYQGASAGFSLTANATQNSPEAGYVKLHE